MAAFSDFKEVMKELVNKKLHRQDQLKVYNSKVLAIVSNDTYSATTDEEQATQENWRWLETWLLLLYPTFLLTIGILGNILTLVILQRRTIKEKCLTTALSALPLVNLWCLGTGVIRYWSIGVFKHGDFVKASYDICLQHWAATAIGICSSHWLIVLVICCRVHFAITPSSMHVHYPAGRMIGLVALVILVNVITQINLTRLRIRPFASDITADEPEISCVWKHITGIAAIIHYIVLNAAPLMALVGLNLLMCSLPSPKPSTGSLNSLEARRVAALHLALIADLHFLIFGLPYSINSFIYETANPKREMDFTKFRIAGLLTNLYFYTGSATQFYFFYFLDKRFARETAMILRGCCRWYGNLEWMLSSSPKAKSLRPRPSPKIEEEGGDQGCTEVNMPAQLDTSTSDADTSL